MNCLNTNCAEYEADEPCNCANVVYDDPTECEFSITTKNELLNCILAEKHTGMMVSCSGLLGRIADGCKVRPDQRYMLGEMYRHLDEMAERFYSGDVKAVDEFLQLYCLDKNRPKE